MIAEKAIAERLASGADFFPMLESYKATPRSPDTSFFKDVAGSAPFFGLFGKESWLNKYKNATLLYAVVVQAHSALFKPGDAYNAGMVVVFSTDAEHLYDAQWLREKANEISTLKTNHLEPVDCKKFISTLRNDQSSFCFSLPSSISNGRNAWCATLTLSSQKQLPQDVIPEHKVLPFLLLEAPKENQFVRLELIPAKYYL